MMTMHDAAAITGAVFWVACGGLLLIALFCAVWWVAGFLGASVYSRLRRVYSLTVIWYWLNRLEKEGTHVFEKAQKEGSK